MRIVLSNNALGWGGVHTVTSVLARGLAGRGHQVAVFGRPASELERAMAGVAPFEGILSPSDLAPATLWRAGRALRRFRPDVVVTLMKKDVRQTAVSASALGIPVVIRHANDQPIPGGVRGRMLYARAMHVTNAQATKRTLLASAPWLAADRVEVIYNGIDPSRWERAVPLDLGLPPGAVAFGVVSALEPRKGLLVLADAWRRVACAVPGAHLLVAGAGSQEGELRARLHGAPRVVWLGHRGDVPRVMQTLDVLVLPSFVEGAPNVVQEAMAAGVPSVATAVSGTPELIRDGVEGLLVPAGDADALAAAMIAAARDGALRARMAAAAHARVRADFGLDAMLTRYEALLARAASRG